MLKIIINRTKDRFLKVEIDLCILLIGINLVSNMSLYAISQYFLVTHAIAFLVAGIVFISFGYKGNRNLNKIKLGWIFVGISSIIATVLILWLGNNIGYFSLLGILIFIFPIIIIIGLIVTLSFGISGLATGYSKPRNNAAIKRGWTFLIINIAITTTIIVLLLMFMSGLIPIRLM